MRRCGVVAAVASAVVVLSAPAAFAHSEFEPSTAAPGSVITLTLHLENEQSDAGTTNVDLRFPEGQTLTVAELPAVDGWTATLQGGDTVPGPATGVVWSRPASSASPDDDPELPVRLGPLPAQLGRLQFKVLQTYSNGEVDRWIDDWPAGAPEPDAPGPVVDLVAGGPGDVPASTAPATTVAPATTTEPSTTSTTASDSASAADDDGDDDGNAAPVIIGIIAAIVVIGGGAAAIAARRRRAAP
jgi:hypothetical protein